MSSHGKFVAKLPKGRVETLVANGQAEFFESGGRKMKEWAALAAHADSWLALAREARRFVGGDRT